MYSTNKDVIIAAYLHDVVEDCGVSLSEIRRLFGCVVCGLVEMLTKISEKSDGCRCIRIEMDKLHLSTISQEAMLIKIADILDNTKDIVDADRKFARLYLDEKINSVNIIGSRLDCEIVNLTMANLRYHKNRLK